jgi:polyisoprenoid-binding protein YceI
MSERLDQPGKAPQIRTHSIARRGGLLLAVLLFIVPSASTAQDLSAGAANDPVHYRIDGDSSWLRVLVYRGGILRGLGHNHVISLNDLAGTVTIPRDPLQATLMLEFKVADLVVDEAESRTLEGDDIRGQISQKAIAGTRTNMLGKKLLQAEQFPSIQIRSQKITGHMPNMDIEATVVIKGTEFTVVFPASVALSNESFVASGEAEIRHAGIGLSPFKAGFGTLKVRDTLVLKYEISGLRIIAPE